MPPTSGDVVSAKVNRISGSGNGIVKVEGSEWNVGPISDNAVGEDIAVLISDRTWAICLSPEYNGLLQESLQSGEYMNHVQTLISRKSNGSSKPNYSIDDVFSVEMNLVTKDSGIAFTNNGVVTIPGPATEPGRHYPVRITSINGWYAEAEIKYETDNRSPPDEGTLLEFTIDRVVDGNAIGSYNGFPILLPSKYLKEGDRIRAGVVQRTGGFIETSIAAFIDGQRPMVGDELTVTVLRRRDDGATAISGGIPVFIPGKTAMPGESMQIGITDVGADVVTGRIDALPDERLPSTGEVLDIPPSISLVPPITTTELGFEFPAPLRMPGIENLQTISNSSTNFKLGIKYIDSDHLFATVAALPKNVLPAQGDVFTIRILNSELNYTIGIHRNFPVFLPIGRLERGAQLHVKLDSIVDCGLEVIALSIEPRDGSYNSDLSEYFCHMQQGVRALHENLYANATDEFDAAADVVDSDSKTLVLWWDAHRHAILAQCEFHRQQNDLRAAKDTLLGYQEEAQQLDENDNNFLRAVWIETQVAMTVIVFLEQIDGAVGPTLGIKVEFRNSLEQAGDQIDRIKRITQNDGLSTAFPHTIVDQMLEDTVSQFDYPIQSIERYFQERSNTIGSATWMSPVPISSSFVDSDIKNRASNTTLERPNQEVEPQSDDVGVSMPKSESATAPDMSETTSSERESSTATSPANHSNNIPPHSASAAALRANDIKDKKSEEDSLQLGPTPSYREDAGRSRGSDIDPEVLQKLRSRAETEATDDPSRDGVTSTTSKYTRSPAIKQYAKARARGLCEWCDNPAPFESKAGGAYLEVHHIEELGEGGSDSPDKVVALCPTCHTQIHYGEDGDKLNARIQEKLESEIEEHGQ